MPYDPYEDDLFEDEEEHELPVIPAPGSPPVVAQVPAKRRPRPPDAPKGNTKATDAPQARDAVIREAQGCGMANPDDWREQLAAGEKSKAAATLSSRSVTHNAASGFGLAHKRWWED